MNKKQKEIVKLLNQLSDQERLEIFSRYCLYCGVEDIGNKCNCWNDE